MSHGIVHMQDTLAAPMVLLSPRWLAMVLLKSVSVALVAYVVQGKGNGGWLEVLVDVV